MFMCKQHHALFLCIICMHWTDVLHIASNLCTMHIILIVNLYSTSFFKLYITPFFNQEVRRIFKFCMQVFIMCTSVINVYVWIEASHDTCQTHLHYHAKMTFYCFFFFKFWDDLKLIEVLLQNSFKII